MISPTTKTKVFLLRVGVSLLVLVVFLAAMAVSGIPRAQAEEGEADARKLAVDAALSEMPNMMAAGVAALEDRGSGLKEFANLGFEDAKRRDLETSLVSLSLVTGPITASEIKEVLERGDVQEMESFINGGWEAFQLEDDRDTVERLAQGSPDDVTTQWAQEALQGDDQVITDFVTERQLEAEEHDKRRDLYELAASPLPSVAAGAQHALTSNSDIVVEEFLDFGQYVAADADIEVLDLEALVARIRDETDSALEAYEEAVIQGEHAARSAEAAKDATERSRDHALAAGQAMEQAKLGTQQAAELARLAGFAADDAVAAADEAHQAMLRTSRALSRAALGAAEAQRMATVASQYAGNVYVDANVAASARQAAEEAERVGRLAGELSTIAAKAAESQFHANAASGAAASAAANADAAAHAAEQAAGAAGASELAAAEAREGAAVARAAAGRARAASNRTAELVRGVAARVSEVEAAAAEAERSAQEAAKAAYEAIAHAGDASVAAMKAGEAAQAAERSAQNAESLARLAEAISDLADEAQKARFEKEAELRHRQAEANAKSEEAREESRKELADARASWRTVGDQIEGILSDPSSNPEERTDELYDLTLQLMQFAPEPISGAAAVALTSGTDQSILHFAANGYPLALGNYEQGQAQFWWENGDDLVAQRAGEVVDSSEEDIHHFLSEELGQLRLPGLKDEVEGVINDLKNQNAQLNEAGLESVFDAAIAWGEEALSSDEPEQLEAYLSEGLSTAVSTDARITAYNSLDGWGPHSKLAAEVAIKGSDKDRLDYLFFTRSAALHSDLSLDAADSQVEGIHKQIEQLVFVAKEAAANAGMVYAQAQADAARAEEYAGAARQYAAEAAQSATTAKELLNVAKEQLVLARQHGERAASAAVSAESDASKAELDAESATSFAIAARSDANQAMADSRDAREAAASAQQDAVLAQSAADRMYAYSSQAHASMAIGVQEAVVDGELDPQPSLWEYLKEDLGDASLQLLKELTGVEDILQCIEGSVSACLWTAAGFLPIGKGAKVLKSLPAIRDLLRKGKRSYERFLEASSLRRSQVDEALEYPSCQLGPRGAGQNMLRSPLRAACPEFVFDKEANKGRVYRVDQERLQEDTDFELVTNWVPSTGLESPSRIVLRNGVIEVEEMSGKDAARLRELVVDSTDEVLSGPSQLKEGFLGKTEKVGSQTDHASNVPEAKALDLATTRPFLERLKSLGIPVGRGVGKDPAQNSLALMMARTHQAAGGIDVRMDQNLLSRLSGKLVHIGKKRPDVQMFVKDDNAAWKEHYADGISLEFDRPTSRREVSHAQHFITANPNGAVVLFNLETKGLSEKQLSALEEFLEKQNNLLKETQTLKRGD